MKYGHIEGPILFRYARTAPIINSPHALEFGVQAALGFNPELGARIEIGRSVKVRLFLDGHRSHMTCHAKIAWFDRVGGGNTANIGLSHLSLSDDEFSMLFGAFTAEPVTRATFGETVRLTTDDSSPVVRDSREHPILRHKALTLPVLLIERVDEERGDTPFSEFVVQALLDHMEK